MTADTRIADFISYRNVCVTMFPTVLKPYPIITENDGGSEYEWYNVAGIPQYNVPPGFDMAANQITYRTGFHEPGHEFDDYLNHQNPLKPHHVAFLAFIGWTGPDWDTQQTYAWQQGQTGGYGAYSAASPQEWWANTFADAVWGDVKVGKANDAMAARGFFLSQVPTVHVPMSVPVSSPPSPTPDPPSVLMGADISNWQGALVDFDLMKTACQFVVIKATEGIGFVDPEFARNWSESKRVGLVRGAYHFAHPEDNDPVAEADYFCNTVTFETGDFVWLDWETAVPAGFDIVQWCRKWLDRVKQNVNIAGVVYLNQAEVDGHDWRAVIDADYGLSLADYEDPLNDTPWPVVAFRQYTSHGAVPGVAGAVDLDIFYGDLTALAKYGKAGNDMDYNDLNAILSQKLGDPNFDLANTIKALKDVDSKQDAAARAGAQAVLDGLKP